MKIIKYNRTSTLQQMGERFKLDEEKYDLTLFDRGVSGKILFNQREKGKMLMEMIETHMVSHIWILPLKMFLIG